MMAEMRRLFRFLRKSVPNLSNQMMPHNIGKRRMEARREKTRLLILETLSSMNEEQKSASLDRFIFRPFMNVDW